MKWDQNVSRA